MVLFHISYSYREVVGVAIILLIVGAPIAAATLTSLRIHRGGWWLAIPGLLFAGGWAGAWALLTSAGRMGDLSPIASLAIPLALGGWCGGVVHLLILAIAGPNRPALRIDDVF